MSSQAAVLERAIQKAIEGGFSEDKLRELIATEITYIEDDPVKKFPAKVADLIFNHDFAKSIWPGRMLGTRRPKWQFHLQQMVLSDDPIAYLAQHLEGEQ